MGTIAKHTEKLAEIQRPIQNTSAKPHLMPLFLHSL
jgi:hypothetical protein